MNSACVGVSGYRINITRRKELEFFDPDRRDKKKKMPVLMLNRNEKEKEKQRRKGARCAHVEKKDPWGLYGCPQ